MKKNRLGLWIAGIIVGIALVGIGGTMLDHPAQKALSGTLIGIGAGLAGMMLSKLAVEAAYRNHPHARRKAEIDEKDERNVTLNSLSKAKAFDAMSWILGILMLVLALMDTPLIAILLLVAAYLLIYGVYFISLNRYSKQM